MTALNLTLRLRYLPIAQNDRIDPGENGADDSIENSSDCDVLKSRAVWFRLVYKGCLDGRVF